MKNGGLGIGAAPLGEDDEISVDEADALWGLVHTPRQAEAVIRCLSHRMHWRYEGDYAQHTDGAWVRGWQFVHTAEPTGLYIFELQRDTPSGTITARLVDATPHAMDLYLETVGTSTPYPGRCDETTSADSPARREVTGSG